MEVIGTLASISQLTSHSIVATSTLIDLHKRLKDGPFLIQKYANDVHHLVDIIELIRQNRLLHTETISGLIDDIFVDVKYLQTIFRNDRETSASGLVYRLSLACKILLKDRTVTKTFYSLEQKKSALILYIAETNTSLFGRVETDLTNLGDGLAEIQTMSSRMGRALEKLSHPRRKKSQKNKDQQSQAKVPYIASGFGLYRIILNNLSHRPKSLVIIRYPTRRLPS